MTSRAVRIAARVASEIPGLPLRTRLTVASLTPACFATSASLRAIVQLYDKSVQILRRAAILCAGDLDEPAVGLCDRLRDRESQAASLNGVLFRGLRAEETVEEMRLLVRRDPHPRVFDLEHDGAVRPARAHRHSSSVRSELDRVRDHVVQELREAHAVAVQRQRARCREVEADAAGVCLRACGLNALVRKGV